GDRGLFLIDVGAARGIHPRWRPFEKVLRTVGFEPNAVEFKKLKQSPTESWINAAVGGRDDGRTLHLTGCSEYSSLLYPNKKLIQQLEWYDDFNGISDVELECTTLDNAVAHLGPHFLKLDTQGSEHEILRGAEKILNKDLVAIEVEVVFCELYENEPHFGDVDRVIRANGFYQQDLANLLFVKPRGMSGIGGPKG